MTTLGKILVFVVLVFSLANGAMVLFVYVTRTLYVNELKKQHEYRQVEQSDARAWKDQVAEVRAEKQVEVDRLQAALKHVQDDLAASKLVINGFEQNDKARDDKVIRAEALVKKAQVDAERHEEEKKELRKTLSEKIAENFTMVNERNAYRDKATAADIGRDAAVRRNAELEKQLQEIARQNAKLQANAGVTTVVTQRGAKNPPPEKIEGLVSKALNKEGLIEITLGTDAGLAIGHTMEVFRLDISNPGRSKYLGTIRITDVTAHEAVGRFEGKMTDEIRRGDTVASRISGG